MKIFFTLCFILCFLKSFSQNYRTIVPGQEQFFVDTSSEYLPSPGYIRGIRAAAVQPLGADSVSYQFYSILDTGFNSCIIDSGPSWIGHAVLLKNNGYNIYFDLNGDSLFINTQAALNDNWKFYADTSGNYLLATVALVSYDSISGIAMDSIKTISLQAKDSAGNNISDFYNAMQLKLSMNHGFVSLFSFRDLYKDNTVFNRVNVHRPTQREIYDYNIGDTLQSSFQYTAPSGPPDYNTSVILNKYYSSNSDTLFYVEWTQSESQTLMYDSTLGCFCKIIQSYITQVDTASFTNLDSTLYSQMPEETIYRSNPSDSEITNYEMFLGPQYYCNHLYLQIIWGWNLTGGFESNEHCYFSDFEPVTQTWGYAAGLGNVYYYFNAASQTGSVYGSQLVYFSQENGSETCGTLNPLLGVLNPTQNPISFSVFPNPAHNNLTLQFTQPIADKSILCVYDICGREIMNKELKDLNNTIMNMDVSFLSAGVYFITLKSSQGIATKKIVLE